LLTESIDEDEQVDDTESVQGDEDDEEGNAIFSPGTLSSGVEYTPKEILVEGWLHKKGTGKDLLGSRGWKARWSRLVLAKVHGKEVDIPLLLVYWYQASETPSTVIVLDSTVVVSVDMNDKNQWNSFRFDIRHATSQENNTIPVSRTFSAPRKARDAWVYAISQALLMHEKQKALARQEASWRGSSLTRQVRLLSRSPVDGLSSPRSDDVWTRDRFVSIERMNASSPPCSPPPIRSRKWMSPPTSPKPPRSRSGSSTAVGARPKGITRDRSTQSVL
jgi:PH domain